MTKQEILDKFNDIDFVYNDSSKHETLSRMLDELLKEQEAIEPYSMNAERTYGICPQCGRIIFRYGNVEENHYCGVCGKKVKWDV